MTQPLSVDVPGLRSLGAKIAEGGDELKRNVEAAAGELVPGGGPGVDGWAVYRTLGTAASGWGDFLRGLSGRVRSAGEAMVTAANGYDAVDGRAAERQGRARFQ